MNSQVHGANDSQQSPPNKEAFKSPYMMMHNNTIKEENEDLDNSKS